MIVVSKCLLGYNCKYNGGNNYNEQIVKYLSNKEYIMVCPEQLGGLPTPRIPSERKDNKVINKNGEDVTKYFVKGVRNAASLVAVEKISIAILKAKSPSCGCGLIYDGDFTGNLISGNGLYAEYLLDHGIKIMTEDFFDEYLANIK